MWNRSLTEMARDASEPAEVEVTEVDARRKALDRPRPVVDGERHSY